MKRRLTGSLIAGLAAGTGLVVFEETARHAHLVASAARYHESILSILIPAFILAAAVVAAIVFVLATVRAGHRKARAAAERGWQRGRTPRRRSRAGADW